MDGHSLGLEQRSGGRRHLHFTPTSASWLNLVERFCEAFAPAEARRVLRKLEFHYVPKHASWLNMVEIEIGVLAHQCLARRIPNLITLTTEVDVRIAARNHAGGAVNWMFGTEHARTKLGHAYPSHGETAWDVAA